MIIVTGAAGFIGSCMVNKLNNKGYKDIVVVDNFSRPDKNINLGNKIYRQKIDREVFPEWLNENHRQVNFVLHLGARTDTTEFDKSVFDKLNLNYSKAIWNACVRHELPIIYASSAATYGDGEHGFNDSHDFVEKLKPLNAYAESKNEFDKWVLKQEKKPYFWAGLKFFNVYGPNEYHKGRMASVAYHTFNQITETGKVKLLRSHKERHQDREQLMDHTYVKDVVSVCFFLMMQKRNSGIYNLGTGEARSLKDLATATFNALEKEPVIEFIDTPEDISDKHQYYTQANTEKLRSIGYKAPFHTLEQGVTDYVQGYLLAGTYY